MRILFCFLATVFGLNILHGDQNRISKIQIRSFPCLSEQRYLAMQLENRRLYFLIDTGSAFSFLRKDVLSEIENKKYLSDSEFIAVNGDKFTTSRFLVSNVGIGDFFSDTFFQEEDDKFWTQSSLVSNFAWIWSWKIRLVTQVLREGVIGMNLFQNFACLFDFPHSCIYLGDKTSTFIENGLIPEDDYVSVPFKIGNAGVIIDFETDLGHKKLLLDSAATISVMRLNEMERRTLSNQGYRSKLAINNYDFGEFKFREFEMAPELSNVDGIIGIDFFKKHVICFNFSESSAYFHTPELGSKERFNFWLKSIFASGMDSSDAKRGILIGENGKDAENGGHAEAGSWGFLKGGDGGRGGDGG